MAECGVGDGVEPCGFADAYIYPLYNGLDQSAVAAWIKASVWIVPWSGAVHLIALGLLGGAIFIVDLRVLGAGLTSQTPAKINRVALPLTILALAIAVGSGAILALSELLKIYFSPPYWLKMASIVAAVTFTFGVRNRLIATQRPPGLSVWLPAVLAVALWAGVFLYLSDTMSRVAMALLLMMLGGFAWIGWRRERAAGVMGSPVGTRLASITTLAMWLTAAVSGRWIAFY